MDIISTRTSSLMSSAAMAAAMPELKVALTGVPVCGSTWASCLQQEGTSGVTQPRQMWRWKCTTAFFHFGSSIRVWNGVVKEEKRTRARSPGRPESEWSRRSKTGRRDDRGETSRRCLAGCPPRCEESRHLWGLQGPSPTRPGATRSTRQARKGGRNESPLALGHGRPWQGSA